MRDVRPTVVLAMSQPSRLRFFGQVGLDGDTEARLRQMAVVDPHLVVDDFADPKFAAALAGAELLLTSWGCPVLNGDALRRLPRLRAVVHMAGSVKQLVTEACWERGIAVSSAAAVNALPVAEYTVAAIVFAGKRVRQISQMFTRERNPWLDWEQLFPSLGNYRKRIGIIGASLIGRRVIELLRPYDLQILVADPFLTQAQADALGVRLVPLDELLAESDVVSIHAPQLPQTHHLLDKRRLGLIRDGATLINTARGCLVDTAALIEELRSGRIDAVLDVTDPEPLPSDSQLYELPNVLLTPHIAGSQGGELRRLLDAALQELDRYASGQPFAYAVMREKLAQSA